MSLRSIHLRKLIKILYLPSNRRVSVLRADIRDDMARENGSGGSGGDFYGPFWSDAKSHVFGFSDLHDTTRARIAANQRRANLYPQLRDGFLLWWNERRRWTNEPFRQADSLKSTYRFEDIDALVKVANILAVRDARNEDHYVYPYWFPDPVIGDEAARLSLWLLQAALPNTDPSELRVLDVIRGQTFSLDRSPMRGNEGRVFHQRYASLLREWEDLRREYD